MQNDTKPMKRNILLIDLRLWLGDFTHVVLKCYLRALYGNIANHKAHWLLLQLK